MTLSLLTVIAIGVLSCLAIPLLPRHAQPARTEHGRYDWPLRCCIRPVSPSAVITGQR
jgi:hypothetical protein